VLELVWWPRESKNTVRRRKFRDGSEEKNQSNNWKGGTDRDCGAPPHYSQGAFWSDILLFMLFSE